MEVTDQPLGLRERKKLNTHRGHQPRRVPPVRRERLRRHHRRTDRRRLIFSIPELKAAPYDEYYRTVTVMAGAIGHRIGRPQTISKPGCLSVRWWAP
jgi:hypothetical protein